MVVVSLLAIGLTGQQVWNNRVADLRVSSQQTVNLAQSLSQQATDSFQTVDGVLQELVDRAETDGTKPAALRHLRTVMAAHVAELPVLHNLFIVDAAGNGVVNAIPGLKNANYRDRPYFIFHRTHRDRTTHVGHTVRSRTDGSWIMTITRRIDRPDGSFAGLAMATISGNYFLHLYNEVDVGRFGVIVLALDDGTILMRKPFQQRNIGTTLTQAKFFQSKAARGVTGSFESRSRLDGVARSLVFHRVSRYPAIVVVGASKHEVLASWRTATFINLCELVAMLSIVGILCAHLLGEIRKRETAEAKLERLVLVDRLTGLGNRRQFDAVFEREWRRAIRTRTSLAFLMIDADEFKRYNDRYGHLAGDNALRSIAGCIAAALGRPADLAARYGGEEFAVFLPDTDAAGAFRVGEKIRRAVVALNIPHAESPHGVVTVSVGVGRMSPVASATPSALVKAADAALYEAKSRGRNRTEPTVRFVPTIVGATAGALAEPA